MRRSVVSVGSAVAASLALGLAFILAGCTSSVSGTTGNNPPPAGAAQVSLSIHDNPPANVTILRFELQVTAATLTPMGMGMGQMPVNMLKSPQEVELEHLQTESALLANASVPAGTYTGLSATFASPQMTILNQTPQTINVGMQSCPSMQVCKLTPALNSATVTVNAPTAPFPLTLSSESPLALLLHFDINASVGNDLSITPMISLSQFQPSHGEEHEHSHLIGVVTTVNSPMFTLQTGLSGATSTITTDNNTQYDFDQACAAANFSCIMPGQVLKVSVDMMSGGALLATRVKLFQLQGHPSFTGTVVGVTPGMNQFQIVLGDREGQDGGEFPQAIEGLSLTVQLPMMGATFTIDTDGLTLPSGLTFATINDLVVGQTVEFQPQLPVTVTGAPPNVTVTVNAPGVRLEPSPVTATISAVNASATPPNFVLGMLPPLFTGAKITTVQVDVVMGTEFDHASGISGLSAGQTVSVSGLLFNTAMQPTMVAQVVKLRMPDGED